MDTSKYTKTERKTLKRQQRGAAYVAKQKQHRLEREVLELALASRNAEIDKLKSAVRSLRDAGFSTSAVNYMALGL